MSNWIPVKWHYPEDKEEEEIYGKDAIIMDCDMPSIDDEEITFCD